MERVIKFRGISKKIGEFIHGMPTFNFTHIFNDEQVDSPDNYEIIPETLGQFTGLTDKNGVEIYEGDIVQINENVKGEIKNASFIIIQPNVKYNYSLRIDDYLDVLEVIGNIHQNPELLT